MRNFLFIWIFPFMFLATGCDPRDYDIVLRNTGSNTIKDAHVRYDNFQSIGGWVSPGNQKTHSRPGIPIPLTAIVEWKTEDDTKFQTNMLIKQNLPKDFRGEIIFEIADSKVKMTYKQQW
ncbi:MAG: hypothetical protein ACK4UN_01215 [Limisphaerales bacterium]